MYKYSKIGVYGSCGYSFVFVRKAFLFYLLDILFKKEICFARKAERRILLSLVDAVFNK